MTVRIEYAPGRLPVFWDRSVVFFANLLGLFYGNEGAVRELQSKVGGIETYGGRLCPLLNLLFTGPDNLLVLESCPDADLLRYFSSEAGLGVPEFVVLHHDRYQSLSDELRTMRTQRRRGAAYDPVLSRIAEHPAPWIDGFVTDDQLAGVAKFLGKRTTVAPEVSRRGNNKLLVHRFLEAAGFPVFDTRTADEPGDVPEAAARLREQGYPRVVVKSQVGATGIGMLKFDASRPELADLGQHLFYEGPCLVQGWLGEEVDGVRHIGSPSMQMFFDETTLWLYDVTEQILSAESIHEGNISPPAYWRTVPEIERAMREQTIAVGQWLHEDGYRGTASADFLVVERGGRIEVRMCEINARVTGATYPSVLARRFRPGGAWLMRNLTLDPPVAGSDLLAALRTTNLLYAAGAEDGLLPINFNTNPAGLVRKAQFLCFAADAEICGNYLLQAVAVLPVKWTYDRD